MLQFGAPLYGSLMSSLFVEPHSHRTCFIERQLFDQHANRSRRTTLTIKLTVVAHTSLQHVYVRPARVIRDSSTGLFGTGLACIERLLCEPWTYVQPDDGDAGGS